MTIFLWAAFCYLLGSVSFAIVLAKCFNMADPRTYGSKNPGTTNMLRSGRKGIAALTLLGDSLKGFLPLMAAKHLADFSFDILTLLALCAFLGHVYPILFKFKGGKGVATFIGCMFALNPIAGVVAITTWFIIALITRFSSLASMLSSVLACVSLIFMQPNTSFEATTCLATMVVLLIVKHKTNIRALLARTESKLFARTDAPN